jgi:hypothetical protein
MVPEFFGDPLVEKVDGLSRAPKNLVIGGIFVVSGLEL